MSIDEWPLWVYFLLYAVTPMDWISMPMDCCCVGCGHNCEFVYHGFAWTVYDPLSRLLTGTLNYFCSCLPRFAEFPEPSKWILTQLYVIQDLLSNTMTMLNSHLAKYVCKMCWSHCSILRWWYFDHSGQKIQPIAGASIRPHSHSKLQLLCFHLVCLPLVFIPAVSCMN